MKRQFFLLGFLSLIVNSALFAADADHFYQKGFQAYNAGNYLSASEHLFAYRQMAGSDLPADFLEQVNNALTYAEAQVLVAIETKKELDAHGAVTKVVIDASGATDSFSTIEKTVPFHRPSDVGRPRPKLPTKPKTMQESKFKIGKVLTPEQKLTLQGEMTKPKMKDNTVPINELEGMKLKYERLQEELKRCQMEKCP